jgi:hypothetical protein
MGHGRDRLAPVAGSSNGRVHRERERVQPRPRAPGGRRVNYARRQHYRRLSRAGGAAAGAAAALGLAVGLASVGAASLAMALILIALGFSIYARHWFSLARRSRVEACSEDEVRRILRALEAEGWRVRHSLRWRGRGDIDSVAVAPAGVAFAIETKMRTYGDHHLRVVRGQAAWLCRRRRRWCRCGAVPVICVVRPRNVQRLECGVLVVSLDRLVSALRGRGAASVLPRVAQRRRTTGSHLPPTSDAAPDRMKMAGSVDRLKRRALIMRAFWFPI